MRWKAMESLFEPFLGISERDYLPDSKGQVRVVTLCLCYNQEIIHFCLLLQIGLSLSWSYSQGWIVSLVCCDREELPPLPTVIQLFPDLLTQPIESVLDFGDKLPVPCHLLLVLAFVEYFPDNKIKHTLKLCENYELEGNRYSCEHFSHFPIIMF